MPYQPRDVLPYSLTSADALVVTVEEGFTGLNVSCKVHTGMATGTPILAIAEPEDDETWLVERDDAGVAVPQGDTEGIVEAVRTWIEDPDLAERQAENAREAFEEHFTEEKCIDDFYDLLVTGEVQSAV
jgi:glycosyltransferase involved in cell wall biosynthesis